MLTNKPIKFDLLSANPRTREVLAIAFRGPAREMCELADGMQADAVIVDLDGVNAQADWKDYHRRHPDRPCIAMTVGTDTAAGAVAILRKPFQVTELVNAVNIVRRHLPAPVQLPAKSPAVSPAPSIKSPAPLAAPGSVAVAAPDFSAVCGTADDIDCDDPQQVQRLSFDADGTLFDWVRLAVVRCESSYGPVTLMIEQSEMAIVCTAKQFGIAMVKDDILKHLCTRKYAPAMVTLQSAAPGKLQHLAADNSLNTSLEALQWKLALWTYRGRLPKGTPINERIYLKHWPNLTRLLEVPDAMRIAALLVDHPMSLPRVAEALAIPQRHVFAFYSAAHAIGLAGVAQRSGHLIAPGPPPRHIERGFMQRIAHHLRKFVA